MTLPPLTPFTVFWLMLFHCLIGLTATAIAYRKGRDWKRWLVIGLIGGTAALVAASVMKPNPLPS
jgi:succinate dehydrogenase hydrophobic anchor subunit